MNLLHTNIINSNFVNEVKINQITMLIPKKQTYFGSKKHRKTILILIYKLYRISTGFVLKDKEKITSKSVSSENYVLRTQI